MRISDWSSDVCSSDLQRARAAIDLARADKRPDFGVNVSLGRRNPDFGNVVSVMGSVTLPIFAGRRQEPRIAAAEEQAAAALAERADALRELEAQFAAHLAARRQTGRATCRDRAGPAVLNSVVDDIYNTQTTQTPKTSKN